MVEGVPAMQGVALAELKGLPSIPTIPQFPDLRETNECEEQPWGLCAMLGSPGMQALPGLALSCQGRTGKGGGGGVQAQQGRFPRSREHRTLQVSSQGGTANTGVARELCELSQLPQDTLLVFF